MRAGVARGMGLGPLQTVSLAEARELARRARQVILDGRDPIEARETERTAAKLEAARERTWSDCCNDYLSAKTSGFKNDKHRQQWRSTLERTFEALGDVPVSAIDTP
jgi:hypothetical protein